METEEAVEVTRLGSEFTVTTNSGEYVTVFAEPYAGDDYLLKRTTSVCTWGLSKTETCKLLVPSVLMLTGALVRQTVLTREIRAQLWGLYTEEKVSLTIPAKSVVVYEKTERN